MPRVNGCIWQRDPERTNWIGLLVGELQSFVDRNSGRNCGFECQHQVPIAVPFHKMACMRPPNLQHSFRSLMGRTFKGRTNQPPSESGQYSRFCLISPCKLGRSRLWARIWSSQKVPPVILISWWPPGGCSSCMGWILS